MGPERLQFLIQQYAHHQLTDIERAELLQILQSIKESGLPPDFVEFVDKLIDGSADGALLPLDSKSLLSSIFAADRVYMEPSTVASHPVVIRPVRFIRRRIFKYAAAIIVLIGVGSYLYFASDERHSEVVQKSYVMPADFSPGGNKAVLTLSDGTTITLEGTANGPIAQQGNSSVIKLANGEILYEAHGISKSRMMINTMTTPRGGQYQLTLTDGTKVWLNAASSITYPAFFDSEERKVKITGEVYLEVAQNQAKPFLVDIDGKSTVRVLGTHFNVNSDADDGNIKTTLIEGRVQVGKSSNAFNDKNAADHITNSIVLNPGQQSIQSIRNPSDDTQLKVITANVEHVLAWKNGLFSFNDSDLRSVMRQLEKWYDVNVKYEGKVSDFTLKGEMYRNVNLSDVLEFLKAMGVRTRMEGKTIIVF